MPSRRPDGKKALIHAKGAAMNKFQLPPIMGHRGAAGAAPENTLVSLRIAAEQGAQWVEFDVKLSGDGVPILLHDDNLKRTTGYNAMIADTPLAKLRTLEAGAWRGPEFAGEPIPTLEEALAELLEIGLSPDIEIKPDKGRAGATGRAAAEVMAGCWPLDRAPALISSFTPECLAAAQEFAPRFPRGFQMRFPARNWRAIAEALGCSTIHVKERWLSDRKVKEFKSAGYGLATFTVNDPKRAKTLIARGVDCIITDNPGEMAAALAGTGD
jgi:glycerophosphoryl diester phosphodiesterase